MKEALLSRAKVTGDPSAKGRATKVSKVGRPTTEYALTDHTSPDHKTTTDQNTSYPRYPNKTPNNFIIHAV